MIAKWDRCGADLGHARPQRGRVSSDQEPDPRVLEERKRLGEHIRSLRRRTGLAQIPFAQLAGIDRKTMYRIENGALNVGIDQYLAVFRALRMPLSGLIADAAARQLDVDSVDEGSGAGSGETPPMRYP